MVEHDSRVGIAFRQAAKQGRIAPAQDVYRQSGLGARCKYPVETRVVGFHRERVRQHDPRSDNGVEACPFLHLFHDIVGTGIERLD